MRPRHNFPTIPAFSNFSIGGRETFKGKFPLEDENLIMLNAPQTALVINQSSLFTFKNYRHQMMYENWLEGQYGYRKVIDDNTSSSAGSSLSEMTFSPKMLAKNSHFLACLVTFPRANKVFVQLEKFCLNFSATKIMADQITFLSLVFRVSLVCGGLGRLPPTEVCVQAQDRASTPADTPETETHPTSLKSSMSMSP